MVAIIVRVNILLQLLGGYFLVRGALASKGTFNWNNREIAPLQQLALIEGRELPYTDFDPPIGYRGDGAPFISVAVIDNPKWISMALNSFISLAKYHNLKSITIMTVGNEDLKKVFQRLGLYAYNAAPTIATFPPDFQLDKHLPYWSWGEIIFMRFNVWFEAFRRGIGYCSLDMDVTYSQDVLYGAFEGDYFDVTMQGEQVPPMPPFAKDDNCKYTY